MDKEEFLETIHSIPVWIKNGDDLLKFVRHLNYKLIQAKEELEYCRNKFKLQENEVNHVNEISGKFDEWYGNIGRGFIPFDEIIKQNNEYTNEM